MGANDQRELPICLKSISLIRKINTFKYSFPIQIVKEERVRRASTSHHHQLQSLLPTLHQGEPFHHYELFF